MLTCTVTFAAAHPPKSGYKGEELVPIQVASPGYFDVIGAVSISKVHAGNGYLGVTSSETDTLKQTNSSNWNSWGGQFGAGYVYFLGNAQRYSDCWQWFPMLEPEVNLYYDDYKNKGDVLLFGDPALNDATYNMPIHSTRLMLDAALTIVSKREYSTYVIAGIGDAWNRVGYSDSANGSAPCITNLNLSNHSSSHFVWEVGAGVAYAFNETAGLSFEYLYTDFGRIQTSSNGNTGTSTPLFSPASFNLHTQALLLGLHLSVG